MEVQKSKDNRKRTQPTNLVLTPQDLARKWGVSLNLIYRELRANRIPHFRAGDRYLIASETAHDLLRGEHSGKQPDEG